LIKFLSNCFDINSTMAVVTNQIKSLKETKKQPDNKPLNVNYR